MAAARKAAGFQSSRAAALAHAWPESTYRAHEAGTRTIGQDDAERYARAFRTRGVNVSAKTILFEERQPFLPVNYVLIRGEAAPRRWIEPGEVFSQDQVLIPAVPGKFEMLEQFAFRIVGPSMELKRIFNGDFVICVKYFDARADLMDGDIVVIEKRKDGLIERTCRELKIRPDGFELWSRPADPKSQDQKNDIAIRVKNREKSSEDGDDVEIVGLVIGRYTPMSRL